MHSSQGIVVKSKGVARGRGMLIHLDTRPIYGGYKAAYNLSKIQGSATASVVAIQLAASVGEGLIVLLYTIGGYDTNNCLARVEFNWLDNVEYNSKTIKY